MPVFLLPPLLVSCARVPSLRTGALGHRLLLVLSALWVGRTAWLPSRLNADPGLSPLRAQMGSKDKLDFLEPEGRR